MQDFLDVQEKCRYEGYESSDETVEHFWALVKVRQLSAFFTWFVHSGTLSLFASAEP